MWITISVILGVLTRVFIVTGQLDASSNNGGYGDRCRSSSNCDSEANLFCIGEFCRCSRDFEIYDHVRQRCVTKEGERCVPPKFSFGEYNPCVSNSYCSETSRICVCDSYAFPDEQGKCIRKKFFNDTCSASRECDDLKYLSCIEGRCGCKLSSYDEYHQICRRRAGDTCMRTKDCVPNADCVNSECRCRENYSETSAKTCGLDYGQTCGQEENEVVPLPIRVDGKCSDVYFACVNGVCRCKNPSYEVYDNETQTCLSLVGGLCHLFLSSQIAQPLRLKNCVENAKCVRRELSPLSQCECADGFVETVSGHCKLPYGASCKFAGSGDELECIKPFVCKNNRCECENELDVYDHEDKSCKRIAGSICRQDSDCIANANCEKSRCKCRRGYFPSFRGACEEDPLGEGSTPHEQVYTSNGAVSALYQFNQNQNQHNFLQHTANENSNTFNSFDSHVYFRQ